MKRNNEVKTSDYKSENAEVEYLSTLSNTDAEKLIGKTVKKVIASEYSLLLLFTDGSKIEIEGSRYGDCSLGVDCEFNEIKEMK